MAMPPLQTRFQLWVARVQNARAVYACSAGRSPFSTSGPADRGAILGAEGVVQPVVADGEGVGHLGDVQEVRRVPVREGGGSQQFLAGAGRPAPVAVQAVEQRQRHHPVQDGPADGEQPWADQHALGGGLGQQTRAVPKERVAERARDDVGGEDAADTGLVLGEQQQARMAEPQGRQDRLAGDGGREGRRGLPRHGRHRSSWRVRRGGHGRHGRGAGGRGRRGRRRLRRRGGCIGGRDGGGRGRRRGLLGRRRPDDADRSGQESEAGGHRERDQSGLAHERATRDSPIAHGSDSSGSARHGMGLIRPRTYNEGSRESVREIPRTGRGAAARGSLNGRNAATPRLPERRAAQPG